MAIVEPTIVELCEKVDCRYTLVVEASTARKLHSCSDATPRWWASSWAKPLKIAVEEINRGLLTYQRDPDLED